MKKSLFMIPLLVVSLVSCEQTDRTATPSTNPNSYDNSNSYDNTNNPNNYNPDNTGRNVRDRDDQSPTPFNQSESKADLTITQKIRQAVMADKSLSTDAKNVKIITINGVVTLRGPVASDSEKANIEKKASQVSGVTKVNNQLEVAQKS